METKDYLDLKAVVILIILTLFWGFITYFVWFRLIHKYSVRRLSVFTFFTPTFGVLFGVLILHEELTGSLMIGLPLVYAGIFLVNWRRRAVV